MSKINNVKIKYFIKSHPIRWPNKSGTQQQTYWKRPTSICRRHRLIHYRPECQKVCKKSLWSYFFGIRKRFKYRIHKQKIILDREGLLFLRCKVTFFGCNFIFLRCGFVLARCGVIFLRCGLIFLLCGVIFLRCNFILARCKLLF